MKRVSLAVLLAAALAPLAGEALAQVYRCDSDGGVPVYQGTPSGRNCRALDMSPLTTIPAPRLPSGRTGSGGDTTPKGSTKAAGGTDAAVGGGVGAQSGPGETGRRGPGASASVRIEPAGFPRVDASTQRARDSDRRRILEEELAREQSRLDVLRTAYDKDRSAGWQASALDAPRHDEQVGRLQADIDRAEANVASLKRELSAIRE